MSDPRPRALAAVPLLLLVGCGTLAPTPTPMRTLERLPVRCEGGTTSEALSVAPDVPALPSADAPILPVSVHLLRMEAETATEAFGVRFPGVDAQIVDAEDASLVLRRLLDDRRVQHLQSSDLALADGRRGFLSVSNEVAYVTGFDLKAVAGACIADPVVETRGFGTRAEVEARFDDAEGPVAIDLSLESVEPYRPTPVVAIAAPGSGERVEVQTPVFNRVRLDTSARIPVGGVLVLAGPDAAAPGDVLVTIVAPNPDGLPRAGDPAP
ncbi:MAG: hypothetical protein ACF8XB_10220 [Planctomycetota bacterium JB042]